jgi:glutaredoxin
MTKHLLFIIVLLFFLFSTANADFYTWVDESGVTHITDYPPPQTSPTKNVQIHKNKADNGAPVQDEDASKDKKKPDVTLFTKNDCKDCDKAREFLQSQNVPFTEYNMDTNQDAVARRKDIDNSEDVPFAIINRNQVYGFSEAVYNRTLKLFP